METVTFSTLEYRRDGTFAEVDLKIQGDMSRGHEVRRNGAMHLRLGPGYRLVKTLACGVCSTDLDRRFLPFDLPQVTGHEAVVETEAGARHVVEINASHRALGQPHTCGYCSDDVSAAGLDRHCPARLVLGIDRLPGGFGPYLLAPAESLIAIPDHFSTVGATLVEPFAAALQAVKSLLTLKTLRETSREAPPSVAVLGTRRLGLLVIAALVAHRRAQNLRFEVVALSRHRQLLDLACGLGADRGQLLPREPAEESSAVEARQFDCVVDTTGSPGGLQVAVALARQEVHLKSTHGKAACGLLHLTELVVDELSLLPAGGFTTLRDTAPCLPHQAPSADGQRPRPMVDVSERPNFITVDSGHAVDEAMVGPTVDSRRARVMPRGTIFVHPSARHDPSPLIARIAGGSLALTSSRCGDFRAAVELLATDGLSQRLSDCMVTHQFKATELALAFEVAESPRCIKAVVMHSDP